MAFRTLVMLCLAATAGGIMTKGLSEGSMPSKHLAAGHRGAKDSDSGALVGIVHDAVEGLAEGLIDLLGEADEADEVETHKASADEEDESDEVETHQASADEDDEADEMETHKASADEEDEADELESVDADEEGAEEMSPMERRAMLALVGFYGGRVEEVLRIVDRGTRPDASEHDKAKAEQYADKVTELMEAANTEVKEDEEDKEADEVAKKVRQGFGEIVDAVTPLATELLDAVLGDDEDEE